MRSVPLRPRRRAADGSPRPSTRGADALIVDLEDAVPVAGKAPRPRARRAALPRSRPDRPEVWVRVNPGPSRRGRRPCRRSGPACRRVPRQGRRRRRASPRSAPPSLTAEEAQRPRRSAGSPLVPLLETAAAVLDALAIARAPRVARLQLGEADLRADLGVTARRRRARAAVRPLAGRPGQRRRRHRPAGRVRQHRLPRPSRRCARRRSRCGGSGFLGRACIHPAQVAVVQRGVHPDRRGTRGGPRSGPPLRRRARLRVPASLSTPTAGWSTRRSSAPPAASSPLPPDSSAARLPGSADPVTVRCAAPGSMLLEHRPRRRRRAPRQGGTQRVRECGAGARSSAGQAGSGREGQAGTVRVTVGVEGTAAQDRGQDRGPGG